MKYKNTILIISFIAFTAPPALNAEDAKKVIAIGSVEVGPELGGERAYDIKETIQLGLKKEIEARGKGRLVGSIVSPAAAEIPGPPQLPTDRPPTQKEIANYTAAVQQWQRQISGDVRVHKPVAADAYFDFKVVSGQSSTDTGGAASVIGRMTGVDTSLGDVSTKTTKVYLIVTMRDPRTGTPLDRYTSKATSMKFQNIGGFSSYDYGNDEIARQKLLSSAIRDCSKWINGKLQ